MAAIRDEPSETILPFALAAMDAISVSEVADRDETDVPAPVTLLPSAVSVALLLNHESAFACVEIPERVADRLDTLPPLPKRFASGVISPA